MGYFRSILGSKACSIVSSQIREFRRSIFPIKRSLQARLTGLHNSVMKSLLPCIDARLLVSAYAAERTIVPTIRMSEVKKRENVAFSLGGSSRSDDENERMFKLKLNRGNKYHALDHLRAISDTRRRIQLAESYFGERNSSGDIMFYDEGMRMEVWYNPFMNSTGIQTL